MRVSPFLRRLIVVGIVAAPLVAASFSPYLAWREPIYIAAGFAGITAMGLLFVQPLLMSGYLQFSRLSQSRKMHRIVGVLLILAIVLHVLGLWITSPPDVIDALLYRSPTPFSFWGVSAMWMLFGAGALVALRRKMRLRPRVWGRWHRGLVSVAVVASVVHTVTITGTMEIYTKILLCTLTISAMVYGVWIKQRRPT